MTFDLDQTGNRRNEQLIVSCQGLVRSIAWKIHQRLPKYVDLEDLVGYGQVGLAEAARDFNPDQGTQFTTFAYHRIRGCILDGLAKLAWFSRNDYLQGRYERLANEALDADHGQGEDRLLGEDVRWFKRATGALAVVYFMCHGSGGADTMAASKQAAPDESAISQEFSEKLRKAIDKLPSDARELIRGAYFDGLSLKEAGERIGISKAWASRLHARTLQQLARVLSEESPR